MKAIFYHKHDSRYDDVTGERYHFPNQYLSRVQHTLEDWIIYYGPVAGNKSRYYSGVAKVVSISSDPNIAGHSYAHLSEYIDFDRIVDYQESGGYEKNLIGKDGKVNGGYAVQAVRHISEGEFAAILDAGLSTKDRWPNRTELPDENFSDHEYGELTDQPQSEFTFDSLERPIVEQIMMRKWRDAKFRQNVRVAYDRTCALTGLRLINGKGRPEVEAAHIKPVKDGGNDWVRNGIALSGTVHWMFDRGLITIEDDFTIVKSRHLNHDVSHLLNKNMKARVPEAANIQPHPAYLAWHREYVFKE